MNRRRFIHTSSAIGLGLTFGLPEVISAPMSTSKKPAILGGQAARTKAWPTWPIWDSKEDEDKIFQALRSGRWSRAGSMDTVVGEFEKKWAETLNVKRCLATSNGTNALIISLRRLGIGAGDEVITTPYTFVATIQAILRVGAMPVFVDVNRATFQIDADKIEEKITPNTVAILPVHILGLPADIEKVMTIAKKHDLLVLEDACQAWQAEVSHKKVGTIGNAGCFSFQNSKNLPIGEGGAIVSNDERFMDRCFSDHDNGRAVGYLGQSAEFSGVALAGTNERMTTYQAAIGLAQLKRLDEQNTHREANATYLKSLIKDIPGIVPYELSPNVTRAVFHLFPFRFLKEGFKGLTREGFIKALRAEGIPSSPGYGAQIDMSFYRDAFEYKNYQKVYPKEMLDHKNFVERNHCPENDILCNEEALWFTQNMLLGTKGDMEQIADAMKNISKYAEEISKL
ncbi:MAG: aminotransferase class V-fold PLP-dependent enzyme [Dysgonamonadaceae bacterium]|nr:aminotransferase class V-fold PLP-dependent enzyme [Dysgonamonadaceae bacterium]